jgi:hypothetical protein
LFKHDTSNKEIGNGMHIKEVPWAKMLGNSKDLEDDDVTVYVRLNRNASFSFSFA